MYSGSSLVDLKAELSRKESELHEKKSTRSVGNPSKTFAKIQEVTGKKRQKNKKHQRTNTRNADAIEANHEVADETLQLLEKARQKLEAKAKIYEKMQSGEMEDVENIYGETKFLVDFQRKHYTYGSDDDDDDDDDDAKCETKVKAFPQPSSSLFIAEEEHREKMHAKWEKEQEDLLNGPVHYENVKFDEVRNLGTGYFAFSKDEEERKKQLEEFQNMRKDTITIQNKKELLHKKRKASLQDRLNKVKSRKLGNKLEAEEKEDCSSVGNDAAGVAHDTAGTIIHESAEKTNEHSLNETATDSPDKDSKTDRQEECVLPQQDEQLLKHCRKGAQKEREWDKGKKCDYIKQPFVKSNEVYSYEKVFVKRRNERDEMFAPPDSY